MRLIHYFILFVLSNLVVSAGDVSEDRFSNDYLDANLKYILRGNTLIISSKVKNLYGDAKGGVSISFPQFKSDKSIIDKNSKGFSSTKVYSSNSKVWNVEKRKLIKSTYTLVEGWSNQWKEGESKRLNIVMNVKGMEQLIINFRAILVKNRKEKRLPIQSEFYDQQGYPVKQIILTFNSGKESQNSERVEERRDKNRDRGRESNNNYRPIEVVDFILDYKGLKGKEVCVIGSISSNDDLFYLSDRTNSTTSISIDVSSMPRNTRRNIMTQCTLMEPCENLVVCGVATDVDFDKGLKVIKIK